MTYKLASLKPRMIVCWDMNAVENKKTSETIMKLYPGVQSLHFQVDLSNKVKTAEVAAETKLAVKEAFKNNSLRKDSYVSMLINNAGIVTGKKILDCPDSLMQLTMDVNTNAHFWTIKAFLPEMMEKNRGHIVTIASSAGLFGVPGLTDYCASKFGAVGVTESLKLEIWKEKKDVNVTLVCPYFIDTGMFSGVVSKFNWFLPIIKPDDMVARIVGGIQGNDYLILFPRVLWLFRLLKPFFPIDSFCRLADKLGVNDAMDNFVGRSAKKAE